MPSLSSRAFLTEQFFRVFVKIPYGNGHGIAYFYHKALPLLKSTLL